MMRIRIRLATRGSRLALAQCALVEETLRRVAPGIVPVRIVIRTSGDRRPDLSLVRAGAAGAGQGLFTRELEAALIERRADAAVHSLKDLPTELPPGLALLATPQRGCVADALVSRWPGGLDGLPAGARVGTSSVRRMRQLLDRRPDLQVQEVRGNVPTRLRALARVGGPDAIVLAEAGLRRLGYVWEKGRLTTVPGAPFVRVLRPEEMLPAAGQGAIGLEARAADASVADALARLNHPATFCAVRAERALLRLLGGGCQMPLGALGEVEGDRLRLRAAIYPAAGGARRATAEGDASAPEDVACAVRAALG